MKSREIVKTFASNSISILCFFTSGPFYSYIPNLSPLPNMRSIEILANLNCIGIIANIIKNQIYIYGLKNRFVWHMVKKNGHIMIRNKDFFRTVRNS